MRTTPSKEPVAISVPDVFHDSDVTLLSGVLLGRQERTTLLAASLGRVARVHILAVPSSELEAKVLCCTGCQCT